MLINLTPIGNSQGFRIPQQILQQVEFEQQAHLEVQDKKIVLTPVKQTRENWEQAFNQADSEPGSEFPWQVPGNSFEQEEWEW